MISSPGRRQAVRIAGGSTSGFSEQAGMYGMNVKIPEAGWPGFYTAFWLTCLAIAGGMIYWFRRRGWL